MADLPDDQRRWVQVARALSADIDEGKIGPGERLPARHVLAARFGTSITTVTRALDELARDGVLRYGSSQGSVLAAGYQARPGSQDAASKAPGFLTVAECARQARLSKMTIYRLVSEGIVESTRVGRTYRIYADSWLAFLNAGRQ
jgi:excisionase family DNA binding protein